MDPGQFGELAIRRTQSGLIARLVPCDIQLGDPIVRIELVRALDGTDEVLWVVEGDPLALEGPLEFEVGAAKVGSLEGDRVPFAVLQDDVEYILAVDFEDYPVVLNGFTESELPDDAWLGWTGSRVPQEDELDPYCP